MKKIQDNQGQVKVFLQKSRQSRTIQDSFEIQDIPGLSWTVDTMLLNVIMKSVNLLMKIDTTLIILLSNILLITSIIKMS